MLGLAMRSCGLLDSTRLRGSIITLSSGMMFLNQCFRHGFLSAIRKGIEIETIYVALRRRRITTPENLG